ncbi:hypothetical protein BJ322DRAFT_1105789 [Thelephora terrestris]|uniref:Uncharacterized protein n=1 Tax=Thelephora terrestris TaxID=56493 RepID=A0A9P6HHV7_9AGAM|nr:hypothetical protein BJ322DRAFT_1105789 [Thelephora terrestris]
MADYERSPKSYHRSYKPTSDPTSAWVSRLSREHAAQFTEMPPSDTESAIFSSDSDAESSHSVPPRFVHRLPDGREEDVSGGYYTNQNASSRDVRSRANSGPVNYGPPPPRHHSRSLHPPGGHPRVQGHPPRPRSSSANIRPPEQIRIRPAQRSMTPNSAGYMSSRSSQGHHPRTSSVLAPSPRQAYDHGSPDAPHHDDWVRKYGPPQPIMFSNSVPPSKYDMPSRDYSANGYRSHSSSRPPRPTVIGSPSSQMSLLTKENTIANGRSRAFSRGPIEDNWSVIDEDEEWEKEQQRAAYRRGRTSSQTSNSPPLTHSRSRTTSSSSGYYPPRSSGPEKMGPPPAHSTGAGSMKRHFFSRWFRNDSDKDLRTVTAPPQNRLRRHSFGSSRR